MVVSLLISLVIVLLSLMSFNGVLQLPGGPNLPTLFWGPKPLMGYIYVPFYREVKEKGIVLSKGKLDSLGRAPTESHGI